MITGKFALLDTATLLSMQTDWIACLHAIAVGNQSYSIAGRSFNRANLSEVSDMVSEISYALKLKSGTLVKTVYSDFSQ